MIESFEDFKINRQLLNAISDLSFTKPTEIQKKAIPQILNGHDLIGIAQTGTGKTASYVIPLLMKLKYAQESGPRGLILVPTRELALQVLDTLNDHARYTDLRSVALYGGLGIKKQVEELEKGVDIIIGTPGRFFELYSKRFIAPKNIQVFVIDEADKMMDMGFLPQIRKILEVIPSKKRQNLLFSATMPEKVEKLTEEFLEFPVKVEITPQATTAQTVEQKLYLVPNLRTKIELLQYLLADQETFRRVLIFTRTKKNADNVYKFLQRKIDKDVRVIHGNKGQNSRINAMNSFKNGDLRILVSTDVSARGIDVSAVSHVINFDVPIIYEDYVHRIGRTGRAELEGHSITFATPAEEYHITKIEKLIGQKIPLEHLPLELTIFTTKKWEKIEMAREVDRQRKIEDPNFKGAFHDKKKKEGNKRSKT